jgi:hypothetical protein
MVFREDEQTELCERDHVGGLLVAVHLSKDLLPLPLAEVELDLAEKDL